ncbi:pyridoxal phosphate-dependent aminotransferase [candidate division KSB1 bacterium]|nr:pyridoxal phosphate-dependent aminotransferase [candidate division KSB1 bacterium]MBL7092807.1 pyridoxal phosphate-dependent aminotransferase [candidate division KSB1 bacterium]
MISHYIIHAMRASSWIRKMFETGTELKRKYGAENVFDLSLGNPIIEPPEEFFSQLKKLSEDKTSGKHRYMPNAGFNEVREKISVHLTEEGILESEMGHIVMSCGAGGGINVILRTLLDQGDEVIVLAPFFSEYQFYVRNHHGKVVVAETDENFRIDLNELENKMNKKTKAIILNSPNNPTGVVYPKKDLKELVDFLHLQQKKYNEDIYLISDEPYREIVFDNLTAPSVVPMYENSFLVYSWSKSLAIPGNRIGYIAVNPHMHHIKQVIGGLIFCTRVLGFVNANAIMQLAVNELLNTTIDVSYYENKKKYIYQTLTDAGYDIVKPTGTFYMFPKAPGGDDLGFVEKAKENRVLVVPGVGFGRKGYFRISYCTDDRTIQKACEKLIELL